MILARDRQSEQARRRRRLYPIHVYCGRNGAGKSLAAVYDTLPDLDAGLRVLSTVRLLDFRDPRPCLDPAGCDVPERHGDSPAEYIAHNVAHAGYVPFTRWDQLLNWRHGPVLMDEITGVASSGDKELPAAVQDAIAQMRRADLAVRITGIAWIRVNKQLREVVNAVTRCRSSMPVAVVDEDGRERMWRARRLAKWVTYDAQSLPTDDHTEHAYDKADKLTSGRHWIPTSPARLAYDTFDQVLRVGSVTDAGKCVTCGGTRRAPQCSCPDYVQAQERRPAARRARSAEHGGRAPGAHARHDDELVAAS